MTNATPIFHRCWASLLIAVATFVAAEDAACAAEPVANDTLRGKVLCGYQAWFRCPGDGANLGWIHWCRNSKRLEPSTLTVDMWPDMTAYSPAERFPAPGFTYPNGKPAELFSSAHPRTVLRHFEWLRDYDIDGVFLQHFVVDLPGGPAERRFASRKQVVEHVQNAAQATGRVWAITFDIAGTPPEKTFDLLTTEWRRLVDSGATRDGRYLHHASRPVVQVFGFYRNSPANAMSVELGNRLIDFFQAAGPYAATFYAGGDWDWRRNSDPAYQAMLARCAAYSPWNVGNYRTDRAGQRFASTSYWAADKEAFEGSGGLWIPVIYPGFSWNNLRQHQPGLLELPRLGGRFYWDQFVAAARLKVDTVYVAMFDEVDEATAIFKITDQPPVEARFVGNDSLPSDWYLRLTQAGSQMLRGRIPISETIPLRP